MNLNNETAIAWLERKRQAGKELVITSNPNEGYAVIDPENGETMGEGNTFWEACHAAAEMMS